MIDILLDLVSNKMIIVPIVAWLIAQVLKISIHAIVEREFRIERLFGDGGMPSAHSATVTSLMVMCGWGVGLDSAAFAISIIVSIIVMHDAMGVRREAGKHANTIKQLAEIVNGMFAGENEEVRTEKLKEFIGHTPLQVVLGAVLGAVVAIAAIAIFNMPYCFTLLG